MPRRAAVLAWFVVIAALVLFVSRLHVDTDMTAFLPRTASAAQRVLVDQFRDGIVSRLVLVAIEGAPADPSAAISKRLAAQLRGNGDFVAVENGEESGFERDREFLWSNRYLLSDRIAANRFTRGALRTVLEHDLAELGSAAGFLVQRTLAADPTGEMLHLIEQQLGGGNGPARHAGVWISPDGDRALMLVRLRAAGSDIDGAQQGLAAIQSAFSDVTGHDPPNRPENQVVRLVMSGPPVFAVQARDRIKSDATRLSVVAGLLVATALLAAYRSPRVLALAFVPVVTGALAGIAMVGLVFRTIHGITLGFGATLIGEAVDYAVYLFTQTTPDSSVELTMARIWPTLRLGVLTSICGFSAMLLSSFEGFAQLGVFTMTGLAVAACVTRWVLPAWVPARFAGVRQSSMMLRLATMATGGRRLQLGVSLVTIAAGASLALGNGPLWAGDLASLSPVPPAEQRLDQSLRRDMGAPDAGYLIVIRRPDQESALQAAERLTAALMPLIGQGALAGFDAPTHYLPSLAAQQVRRAALPEPAVLQAELDSALDGLPFQPGLFAPFTAAVARARSAPPIDRTALDGTSLSLKLDSLLLHRTDGWVAMLSLRGVTDAKAIAGHMANLRTVSESKASMQTSAGPESTGRPVAVTGQDAVSGAIADEPDAVLVDLKAESDRLLGVYLREGVSLASLGAIGIGVLLAVSIRSLPRLLAVMAPLVAAVVVTLAVLRLGGHALSIFNLFGMLLVVAIGSNYCLFFDRQRADPAGLPRVLASLLLANGCTVAGFGVLGLSQTPVLHDLGMPVALGTFLSLVFATIIMSPMQIPTPSNAAPG